MTDREFVAQHWEQWRCAEWYQDEVSAVGGLLEITRKNGQIDWQAAAEFTRERKEQIRQLQKEIETVARFRKAEEVMARDGMQYGASWAPIYVPDLCVWSRVLARLEAALADLTKGMKEEQ